MKEVIYGSSDPVEHRATHLAFGVKSQAAGRSIYPHRPCRLRTARLYGERVFLREGADTALTLG